MIRDEDLERVRRETDIVAVISGYTMLKRSGQRFVGLCPFHTERSPSFSVNADLNLYHCFGCQASGDTIRFVREKEGLDFVGAVEWLARKGNIPLRYTDADQGRSRKRREEIHELIGVAAAFYHDRLLTAGDAAPARAYLRGRGLDGDVVREFGIGWAPDGWDALAKHLRVSDTKLTASGLGIVNRRKRQQDSFRARIIFPIADVSGRPVGFGGRILPGVEGQPKYINSRDSDVYDKSSVLYGLDRHKSEIVAADQVIVCEGYTDVIGYHIAGVPRAVATCGTALTHDHVKALAKFAKRVVLSFDSDAAGQNAAARFYEWEREFDLDVRVADLPAGSDPGDLARTDPDRLAEAVTGARPFLEFRVSRALAGADLSTVEGRARAAEAAMDMVREHPDPLVRDGYALRIADQTRTDEAMVRTMLGSGGSPPSGSRVDRAGPPRRSSTPVPNRPPGTGPEGTPRSERRDRIPRAERLALAHAIHDGPAMAAVLSADAFSDDRLADTYDLLLATGDVRAAMDQSDPDIGSLLTRLAVEQVDTEPLDVACRVWTRFLRDERSRRMGILPNGEAEQRRLIDELNWFQSIDEALREPSRQEAAVGELLAWIAAPVEEVG